MGWIEARASRLRKRGGRARRKCPRLIDEVPILAVAAALGHGELVVRDAAELRVKESDRIATLAEGLRRMGVAVDEHPDGLTVHGRGTLTGAPCAPTATTASPWPWPSRAGRGGGDGDRRRGLHRGVLPRVPVSCSSSAWRPSVDRRRARARGAGRVHGRGQEHGGPAGRASGWGGRSSTSTTTSRPPRDGPFPRSSRRTAKPPSARPSARPRSAPARASVWCWRRGAALSPSPRRAPCLQQGALTRLAALHAGRAAGAHPRRRQSTPGRQPCDNRAASGGSRAGYALADLTVETTRTAPAEVARIIAEAATRGRTEGGGTAEG